MRTRVLLSLTGLLLALVPSAATADQTPPPPQPLPAASGTKAKSKAPRIAYTALPFSEAAGPGRGFLGAGDIRLMRSDASDDRPVTTGPATEFEPAFSPDGKLIAFSSDRADVSAGRTDIWVVRPDGSGLRRVTTGLNAREPAWSPDGRRIAAGTDRGIATFSTSGKELVLVTTNTADHVDFSPVWDVDGTRVLFTRTTRANGVSTGQSLWSAAADGSRAKPVLGDTAPGGYLSQPDVSRDGTLLTFLQADAAGTAIWLADRSGSVIRRLAHSSTGRLNSPTFSADGRWVLFTHGGPDGRSPSSMRLISLDAKKTKLVTRIKQGNYYAPSWDPTTR